MNNDIKRKRGQPSKAVKYPNERLDIAKKILKIIKITKDNKTIILNNFNLEQQQEILDLENEIRKYFNAGNWTVFKKGVEVEKCYLSIIRNVMREVGIIMINSTKYVKGQHYSCYTFEINDELLI